MSKAKTDDAEQEQLETIRREALSYGYHLSGTLPEMQRELRKLKKERQGLPSCFKRMYTARAPECRVCHLVHRCADRDVPGYIPAPELEVRRCPACEVGQLSTEILDEMTAEVVDYGCTTTGCTYTIVSGMYRPASEAELQKVANDARKHGIDPAQAIIDRIKRGTIPRGIDYDNPPEEPKPKRGRGRPRKNQS